MSTGFNPQHIYVGTQILPSNQPYTQASAPPFPVAVTSDPASGQTMPGPQPSAPAPLRPMFGQRGTLRACEWCGPWIRGGFKSSLGGLGITTLDGPKRRNVCTGLCTPADVWTRLDKAYTTYKISDTWGLGLPGEGKWTTCPERILTKGRGGQCTENCSSRSLLQSMSTIRQRIQDQLGKLEGGDDGTVQSALMDLKYEQKLLHDLAQQRTEQCRAGWIDCCSLQDASDSHTTDDVVTALASASMYQDRLARPRRRPLRPLRPPRLR